VSYAGADLRTAESHTSCNMRKSYAGAEAGVVGISLSQSLHLPVHVYSSHPLATIELPVATACAYEKKEAAAGGKSTISLSQSHPHLLYR
jgi:hypothetical protein